LRQLFPVGVEVLRDGTDAQIPAEQLALGDIALHEQGDNVTAACRMPAELNTSQPRSRQHGVRLGRLWTRAEDTDQRLTVDGFFPEQGLRQMVQRFSGIGQ
jgi:hypothetical protein